MATTPFTAAREAALKENIQGGRLAMLKQWQDTARFHCCISGNTVGVPKSPVPDLTIDDRVVCTGANVTVDFSASFSPTDTLAGEAYTIVWGDGSPDTNGNFPNPRNPALETATYVGGYADVGYYDITITIVDSLGVSSSFTLQVYARDCTEIPNPLPFPVYHYPWTLEGEIVASDSVVYYTEHFDQAVPAWNALAGAPNPAFLEVHDVQYVMDLDGTKRLYTAGSRGIYSHPMPPDEGDWTFLVDVDDLVDAAGLNHAVYTTFCQTLASCIYVDGRQWVSWVAKNPFMGARDYIAGVAWTYNDWATIAGSVEITRAVFAPFPAVQAISIWGLDIVQQQQGQTVYAAIGVMRNVGNEESGLWRSLNYGAGWARIDTWGNYTHQPDVWVPLKGAGSVYYWGTPLQGLRRNAVVVGTIAGLAYTNTYRISGPRTSTTIATLHAHDRLYEYHDGAFIHITPDLPNPSARGHIVRTRTAVGVGDEIAWVGGSGVNRYIKVNQGGAQINKDGGWGGTVPITMAWPELREFAK